MAHDIPNLRRVRVGKEPMTLAIDWKGGGRDTVDLTGLIARRKVFAHLPTKDQRKVRDWLNDNREFAAQKWREIAEA